MQQQIEDIISVGDHLWVIFVEEDTPPVESEKILFAGVRNILQEDFGIEMEPTPSLTLYEEKTIAELQQEELVWKTEHDTMMQEQYEWDTIRNDILPLEPPKEVLLIHNPVYDNYELNKNPAAKETRAGGSPFIFPLHYYILGL
jgi:hypothetical protein